MLEGKKYNLRLIFGELGSPFVVPGFLHSLLTDLECMFFNFRFIGFSSVSVISLNKLIKPIYLEHYTKWPKVLVWLECLHAVGLAVCSTIIIIAKSTYLLVTFHLFMFFSNCLLAQCP